MFKLRPEDMGLRPYGWTEEDERAELSREKKHLALPGVPLEKALKTVPFVCMFLFAGLIAYFAGFNSHLPGFAQSVGHSALVGSSLLTAVMIGNVVEKLFVGWLNDKVGVQLTVNIQLAMVALGFIGFIFSGGNLVMLYISAFLFGAQNSLVSVSTPLLIRQIFGERRFPGHLHLRPYRHGCHRVLRPGDSGGHLRRDGQLHPCASSSVSASRRSAFITTRLAYVYRRRLHWVDADGSVLPEAPSTKC